jgi:hypothetical protein
MAILAYSVQAGFIGSLDASEADLGQSVGPSNIEGECDAETVRNVGRSCDAGFVRWHDICCCRRMQ